MMVLQNLILQEFNKIALSFLWKGQWISADEWTKYIKASKGMETVDVQDVNRAFKKIAATVGPVIGDAPPMLFVNERKVMVQVVVKDDTDQQVSCMENKKNMLTSISCQKVEQP